MEKLKTKKKDKAKNKMKKWPKIKGYPQTNYADYEKYIFFYVSNQLSHWLTLSDEKRKTLETKFYHYFRAAIFLLKLWTFFEKYIGWKYFDKNLICIQIFYWSCVLDVGK